MIRPDLLTGPDAGEFLRAALAGAGAELLSWRTRQVEHQPGRGATAAYQVRVRWPDGRTTEERFAACTRTPPEGTLLLDDGDTRLAVWRFPHDPYLPGLSAAYDPEAVAGALADLDLGGGPVRLTVRAYRPRRRAVLEAVNDRGRVFVKVVRPARVAALHERHRLLAAAGVPAPQSLGFTPDGLLVLAALPGRTLREVLRGRNAPLPDGEQVLDLLDRLPAELTRQPRRTSWGERARHYATVVGSALPAETERCTALAEAIGNEGGTGPTVPVHGDFYESQLHVLHGRISGLLDVDTAGPGDRLDDLACLLGHLSVLAQIDQARSGAINRLGARYLTSFARRVDPADLRYRVAAVVLSLATGPYRVQEPGWPATTRRRLDLAERWLASARAVGTGAGPGRMRDLSPAGQKPLIRVPNPGT
ncbi:phosphotransferase [Polymorphospora sp. NPDC051019]|uniref:phosphotransferase family protein n=1 Tax=Polymorphospora sp. NPDC051019 TaxID=3155725 RepID=UPI0034198EA8